MSETSSFADYNRSYHVIIRQTDSVPERVASAEHVILLTREDLDTYRQAVHRIFFLTRENKENEPPDEGPINLNYDQYLHRQWIVAWRMTHHPGSEGTTWLPARWEEEDPVIRNDSDT